MRWRWEGNAFGDTVPNEDPTYTGVPTTINLRYAGQYYDKETGLHYNWNRYYDPRLGRYITSDPIGLRGGLNTYAYVRNNPLRWKDPRGLFDDGFPGMGDPLEGWIDQMNSSLHQPTPDTRCVQCFIDFFNPIPDIVSETAAEKVLGELASQGVKKVNKIKGAYDLAECLRRCRDDKNCKN